MRQFRFLPVVLLFMLTTALSAAPPELVPDPPSRYTVQSGDTLWDIASRFLRSPWRWPEIWQVNPAVRDPNLIYPGDVLLLSFDNGVPRISLDNDGPRQLKLLPGMRREALSKAIATIPIDAIQQFLTRPRILSEAELNSAPEIVAFVEEHLIGGAGDQVYVSELDDTAITSYDIVRPEQPYRDPDSGENLGYEARYIGDAQLLRPGSPAKVLLSVTTRETLPGDRLLPDPEDEMLHNFEPQAAPPFIEGKILSVLNGVSQIGLYSVVVINKGADDGLAQGHVMRVMQRSKPPRGVVQNSRWRNALTLPTEDVGLLMVFRTFDRVSYALIMRANRAIHVHDHVASPQTY
jgi:hypothetical protein